MITKDSKNILVAEDSIFFRVKLKDILENGGHNVTLAKNGREAIEAINGNGAGFDLLILDLHMPGMDGFEVLEWLNNNGRKFPVLVVSTVYDEPGHDLERIKELGATGLMSKGFSPQQVVLHANRLLFPEKAARGDRSKKRVPVSVPVEFSVNGEPGTGFVLNLSDSGLYLKTEHGPETGAVLVVRFTLPGIEREFELKGEVRWTTRDFNIGIETDFEGCGVMFTGIGEEERAVLRKFVNEESVRLGLG